MIPGMSAMTAVTPSLSSLSGSGTALGLSPASGQQAASSPFSDLMTDAVGQVDQLESKARTAIDGLMTGSGVDVHEAMIASQKASMAFDLALAVRNKAVQAYQQVIGMQF